VRHVVIYQESLHDARSTKCKKCKNSSFWVTQDICLKNMQHPILTQENSVIS